MSISLATLGFTIAGILFLIYTFSFQKAGTSTLKKELAVYSYAYLLLGIAFIIWGIATLIPGWLQSSVIIGDLLLLFASTCLLVFLSRKKAMKWTVSVIGIILSLVFIWWRTAYLFPVASIQNGVLLFNTQLPVVIVLSLVFLIIWLPANLKAARLVAVELHDPAMRLIYSFIYVISTLSAIAFISVKTPTFAALAFVLLGLCFILLLYSNFIQKKIYSERHG